MKLINQPQPIEINPTAGGARLNDTAAQEVHRIIIQPAKLKNGRYDCTQAGQKYVSWFHNEIICTSTQPFYDSARVLKARGYKGAIEMSHHGSNLTSMIQLIEDAARLTIEEGNRSPKVVKYKPLQTAPKSRQATPIPPSLKKPLGELTAVQGIEARLAHMH